MPSMEEIGLGAVDHANVVTAVTEQYKNDSRSSYVKYSEYEHFMIGKYANENDLLLHKSFEHVVRISTKAL